MFQMPVIEVPTNLPNIRKDLPIQAFAVGYSIFIIATFFFQLNVFVDAIICFSHIIVCIIIIF